MGTNTLTPKVSGATIFATDPNELQTALNGDFVGRNSSGVPTSGQNLGTASIPWGTLRAGALVVGGASVDVSQVAAPPYRVISGKTRTTSNQPAFLTPSGSGLAFDVKGLTTSLIYDVNGQSYTLSSDLTKSSLTAAPSTNNTCLVNDAVAADQEQTRTWGEYGGGPDITVDAMGSEISSLVGTWQAFKINDGSNDEYFVAFIESSTKLSRAYRGYFYNSSLAPVKRIKFANNDTITLLKAAWVFLDSDGTTVDVTYTNPVYAAESPGSPVTGDYWFDLSNALWKRYDGASFQIVTRTYIGVVASDTTSCIAARCVDFDAATSSEINIRLQKSTSEIVIADDYNASVSVNGRTIRFGSTTPDWNITTDFAAPADMYSSSEANSTYYYAYVTDLGDTVISDISPYYRPDLRGWYHPHNPWRMVGSFFNDGSGDISDGDHISVIRSEVSLHTGNGHGATSTKIRRFSVVEYNVGTAISYSDDANLGTVLTINETGWYFIQYRDQRADTAAHEFGVSVNATQLTTRIGLLSNLSEKISHFSNQSGTAEAGGQQSVLVILKKGDLVRPHTDGSASSTGDPVAFKIRLVKPLKGDYIA